MKPRDESSVNLFRKVAQDALADALKRYAAGEPLGIVARAGICTDRHNDDLRIVIQERRP